LLEVGPDRIGQDAARHVDEVRPLLDESVRPSLHDRRANLGPWRHVFARGKEAAVQPIAGFDVGADVVVIAKELFAGEDKRLAHACFH
jgi:hypothetical protein